MEGSGSTGGLHGDDLVRWDGDDRFASWVASRIGPSVRLGHRFACPWTAGLEHQARFWRDERHIWVYMDSHHTDDRRSYVLAEAYAASVSRRLTALDSPELARWKLRALAEYGAIERVPVTLPPLPLQAAPFHDQVKAGIELLLGVRWLTEPPGSPTPLTKRFLARWCGVSEHHAERAKLDFIAWDIIRRAGRVGATVLWVPALVDVPPQTPGDEDVIDI